MALRILQVIDTLDIGGAEKITVMIANMLVKKEITSDVLTLVSPGLLSTTLDPRVNLINLNRKSKWDIISAIRFQKIVNEYDIAHIHLYHNLNWVIFWNIFLGEKINIVFHDHGNKILKWNFLYKVSRNQIYHIVVNKKLYQLQMGKKQIFDKIYFVENTIMPRKPLGKYVFRTDELNIVIISNIYKNKNIEFAIKLIKNYKKMKNITLDIYYTHTENEYYKRLREYIFQQEMSKNINFIAGEIEPQQFLYKYDFGIHPSYRESGPLAIQEFIAHGIPFVTYNSGQAVEVLKNIYPEFLLDSFNEDNWHYNINMIIKKGRLFYQDNLKKIFSDNLSLDHYYNNCKKIYLESLV